MLPKYLNAILSQILKFSIVFEKAQNLTGLLNYYPKILSYVKGTFFNRIKYGMRLNESLAAFRGKIRAPNWGGVY